MSIFKLFLVLFLCINALEIISGLNDDEKGKEVWDLGGPLFVKREERRNIASTENGQVTAARVSDRVNGSYLLHFITLERNSLFLPVLLHADMVFYVHTGTGSLRWNEDEEVKRADVTEGDVYRLPSGTVFFAQSSSESVGQKLRIYAIFANSINDLREPTWVHGSGPYTSIRDLVLGFDKDVLRAAFQVPEAVIEDILSGSKQPSIIPAQSETERPVAMWDKEMEYLEQLVAKRGSIMSILNKKKKHKEKMYNIMEEDKDFENRNGWSSTVTSKNLDALKGSDIGIFMVNLTKGSMMGPHWNPIATEIAIVLKGQGMVRVVCPKTIVNETECENMRFHVNEGDVFVVPRFHPMAQMAFNNGSFVFMGFSTSAKNNHPQFLAGKASIFRTLNVDVVATSFDVSNTTITRFLAAQDDSVILKCVSCAEEEFRIMEDAIEREMEERRKREEEAARKREEERKQKEEEEKARKEEEERKRREEEEEAQRKEEEERKRREEEEAARKQKEEEEKARKEEEERKRREEEEEAGRKEEEERKRREEEAAARKEEEERKRKEEEARQREEEKARKEEEERKRREEEEAAKREEEKEQKRREEEEKEKEAREREEQARREEEDMKQREEEEKARREEEERKRREEEAKEEEEERKREEQQQRKQEEEARKKEEEARREEEERRQREEEESRRREEEEARRRQEAQRKEEEEARRRWKEEQARRAEEAARRAAEERERRASEEARRAAEEEKERERREWEHREGRGGKWDK